MAVTVVVALKGERTIAGSVLERVAVAVRALRRSSKSPVELVVVAPHESTLLTLPTLQVLQFEPSTLVLALDSEQSDTVGSLFNRGISAVAHGHVVLYDAREPIQEEALPLINHASRHYPNHMVLVELPEEIGHEVPARPPDELLHAWLLSGHTMNLSTVAVPLGALQQLGPLDDSKLGQEVFSRTTLVRLSCATPYKTVGVCAPIVNSSKSSLTGQPSVGIPRPILERYVAFSRRLDFTTSEYSWSRANVDFLSCLPESDRARTAQRISLRSDEAYRPCSEQQRFLEPARILVICGLWEHHHNELVLYPHLERMADQGLCSFSTVLEDAVTAARLGDCDLAILSRVRGSLTSQILDWCEAAAVPTIYMIDDNWFEIGDADPTNYGAMFAPGATIMKNFVEALRRSSFVLTFNRILGEDLAPYARNLVIERPTIDVSRFERWPRPVKERLVIGFAGSPRLKTPAMGALLELSESRRDLDVYVMGYPGPEAAAVLDHSGVKLVPWANYDQYARTARSIGFDIMLAPLDSSRFSQSKCPNKFLEISCIGAVGIYSDVEPYKSVVVPDQSGILIRVDSSASEWLDAIESTVESPNLQRMKQAAREQVIQTFDVEATHESFVALVERARGYLDV